VSRLSHPYICALYDVGQQDGIDYLVMEYIEGEPLSDRIAKGALPLDQALRYANQIADALDKAHRTGIVHRDLKPANIMLTKSGAKLLDFGLAKLLDSDPGAVFTAESNLPTERISLTGEGTILGTFQYMAPEQLEAGQVDARTDVFAFGAVLYEMITGRKAFTGKSQSSLIAAILEHDPEPMSVIQPMTPPTLDHVVKTCLAKEPDERWQTAHDLMLELKWVAEAGSQASAAAPIVVRGRNRERLAWIAATVILLLALIAALLLLFANSRRSPTEVTATRFLITPSERQSLTSPTVSPDGRRLVYFVRGEGGPQLWVRQLDSFTAQPLPGIVKISWPSVFWSPDSRSIGFFADGKLKKMEISGGLAQTIADAPNPRGGSWSRDGVIVFCPSAPGPLYRVSAAGGEATQLTTLDESAQETRHLWPFSLPDGRHFLYIAPRTQQRGSFAVYVGSLDSKETKLIMNASSNVAYAPPGYLLFSQEETLMAQPFDAEGLQVTGEAFPVVEDIRVYGGGQPWPHFSVSDSGVLVYMTGGPTNQLTWFDRSGKQLGTVGPPGNYLQPRLSPDEKRAAFARRDSPAARPDIWVIELARGVASRLTSDPAADFLPVWSPDGSRIVFSSNREGSLNLYQKLSSGAGGEEELLKSPGQKQVVDWSPDGRFILYFSAGANTKSDIWVLPLEGDRKPYPLLQTEFAETGARFSADGRWVAYVSNETGTPEVYVREFQGSGGRWRVSTGGGNSPRWRRDGKELFYASGGKLMAVDVKASGSSFEPGVPKLLFETSVPLVFDVSGDGQRFLFLAPVEESSPEPIDVVLNWTADLKR
jgi:serine/threonine protein kinase